MIIDSHAHYAHWRYEGEFSCLDYQDGAFCVLRTDRAGLLNKMAEKGIACSIEAGISLDRAAQQLALETENPDLIRNSYGMHPSYCNAATWEQREMLPQIVRAQKTLAIGETGLDYHLPELAENREYQRKYFLYHLELAHELGLPLILHVRDGDAEALEILRQHRQLLHGGVAHCFGGDYETAMAYIDLGFAIGIGARVLQEGEMARTLGDTVAKVPLEAILLETDAPYILPQLPELDCSGKQRKKLRNSSLILPAVLEKIAQLRNMDAREAETAIYDNTLRIFRMER